MSPSPNADSSLRGVEIVFNWNYSITITIIILESWSISIFPQIGIANLILSISLFSISLYSFFLSPSYSFLHYRFFPAHHTTATNCHCKFEQMFSVLCAMFVWVYNLFALNEIFVGKFLSAALIDIDQMIFDVCTRIHYRDFSAEIRPLCPLRQQHQHFQLYNAVVCKWGRQKSNNH